MARPLLDLVDQVAKEPTKRDLQELRLRIEAIQRGVDDYPPDLCMVHVKDILQGNCITY